MPNINYQFKGPFASGERQGSATAVQMPSVEGKFAILRNLAGATGAIYYGYTSGVTVPANSTDTTSGMELSAGQASPLIPLVNGNLDQFYVICANAGDAIVYEVWK